MNDSKVKLGPIIIGVNSIDAVKDFYINVFGIEIKERSENYLSAYIGDIHIEIEEDSENRFPNWAKNNIGTYKCVEFTVSDMEVFLKETKAHGGKVVSEPIKRPWGSVTAEIADPEGNIFLISQS